MGSDDLHKRRKAREAHSFARQVAERETYANILIVCEGETEAVYLQDAADDLSLHRRRIQIKICSTGTDPLSIVTNCIKLDGLNPGGFDTIYCVFDGVGNTNIKEALAAIEDQKAKGKIVVPIISYPCFEYWLLMHYSNSTSPIKSDSDMLKELKCHIKDYKKGGTGLYNLTNDFLSTAIKNSKHTNKEAIAVGNPNPSTNLFILIEQLMEISRIERLNNKNRNKS